MSGLLLKKYVPKTIQFRSLVFDSGIEITLKKGTNYMDIELKPNMAFTVSVLPVQEDGVTQARVENPNWAMSGSGFSIAPDASDWHVCYVTSNSSVVGTEAGVIQFNCDADLDAAEVRPMSAVLTVIVKEPEAVNIVMNVNDTISL